MLPDIKELNDLVVKKQKEIEIIHENNIRVFIECMGQQIGEIARNGQKDAYFDQKWFEKTIQTKNIKDKRTVLTIKDIIKNKINDDTEYYSYHNMNGLRVTWDKEK